MQRVAPRVSERRTQRSLADREIRVQLTPAEAGKPRPAAGRTEDEVTHSKWNVISVVSFGLMLLAVPVIFAHTAVSGYIVLGLMFAALVLGIIALLQIRKRGQKGQGFALATVMAISLFWILALIVFSTGSY